MRILYAAAEVAPYSKVGGLADVAGSLPKALAARGHATCVISPAHASIPEKASKTVTCLSFLGREEEVSYRKVEETPGSTVFLVENATYFGRGNVYGFHDDLLRYQFFSLAVLQAPEALDWRPDVVHCNDWHTAWLPLGLRNRAWQTPFYQGIASIITIHNLAYRGPDPLSDILGPGILYADAVNTVSPTYAREITTPEHGGGLDELLRLRGDHLYGILNGIDTVLFDPSADPALAARYTPATIESRAANKAALQQRMGLAGDPAKPLIGMVSRLDQQKGIDLVLDVLGPVVEDLGAQVAILGRGSEEYQALLRGAAVNYPDAVAVEFGFRSDLATLVYGGVDLFLMPSRFEPCGLGQLIAMRYGAVPVVRRTGGLADTVAGVSPDLDSGTGFVFDEYRAEALLGAIEEAVSAYREEPPCPPGAWRRLIQRSMSQDFTWDRSAQRYEEMYTNALRRYS